MRKKAYGIFAVLLVLLGAAVWSLVHISGGSAYVEAAEDQSVYKLDVAKGRGIIYDCQLRPLVGEKKKYLAAVAPTIESIGALEQATGGKYRQRLRAALEEGKPFSMELEEDLESPLIDLFRVPERYSENQLAPHVIGYLDSLGRGAAGVELALDDILSSFSGEISVYYQVDALGRVVPGGERQTVDTLTSARGGAALTLDRDIQALVEESARELGEGAVVVLEVPNGEIRGIASLPDYSPQDIGKAARQKNSPLLNRAFCAYAPGSVFKLITAAVELEEGELLSRFTCTGSVNAGGLLFHCIDGKAHGQVDLKTALEKSCNCYFISAVRALGGQETLNMAYNLGLGAGQEFGRGLSSDPGNLPEAESLKNVRALANFAFGQGEVTVTPLQLCAMMNVIASDGVYSTPKLLLGQVNEGGTLTPFAPVTDKSLRVMSASTAQKLQEYLKSAAREGTAVPGAPRNCVSGAKTGTAQTGVYRGEEELLHFWYCGFVEDESGPRYCVTVLRESSPNDGGAAARVYKKITEALGDKLR